MVDYENRIKMVREECSRKEADAFLLKGSGNIRYLSCTHLPSYAVLNYLFIPANGPTVGITSSMEEFRAREEAYVDELRVFASYRGIPSDGKDARSVIRSLLKERHITSLLMDSKEIFRGVKVTQDRLLDEMRSVKDDYEIEQIKKAVRIVQRVGNELHDLVRPGMTEAECSREINYRLLSESATMLAFNTIVAAGRHAHYPHHDVTRSRIGVRDSVVVDIGVYVEGYCSDITRTLLMPSAPPQVKEIYEAVEEAQRTGIRTVKEGEPYREIERSIRAVLKEYGLDRYFVHSTGHGIGLEVHESPFIRMVTPKKEVVRDGNVFTIEPGVYVPGVGGVRIEDDILVKNGVKVLR